MDKLLLSKSTEKWLDAFLKNPKTSLLIECYGDQDSAVMMVEKIRNILIKSNTPVVYIDKEDNKNTIGIDSIRGLLKSLAVKADSEGQISRIYAIKNADSITEDAQNVLLKSIEELPDRTLIVLISSDNDKILDTIKSRCINISMQNIDKKTLIANHDDYDIDLIEKAYNLSDGRLDLFRDVLANFDDYDHKLSFAKKFLTSSIFERQNLLKDAEKQNVSSKELLQYLKILARSGMIHANNADRKKKFKDILQEILEAEVKLGNNANPKLTLMNLSLSI